ncbi:MAG: ABC transporter ATP-binding protein [Bryobacterales bacterium]|nr:ABC transporter ATP-binding protein [Bryobacterales bacterium]
MIVDVENLVYRYPPPSARGERAEAVPKPALNGVTFSIAEPRLTALLGPNGSGKSTLFRILATLLSPQAGRASIGGLDLACQPMEARRALGVVFQESSLDRRLTVRENLSFAGQLYGMQGAHLAQRIQQTATQLDLQQRLDHLVSTLSGGWRRRAEIARCLLHQPQFLLLDEPTAGLDPLARADLWRHLRRLQDAEGVAVLVSTHFLDEAALCDWLLILHEGRIAIEGAPAALCHELGGEVVEIVSHRANELGALLAPRAGFHVAVVDDVVRVECPNGPALISSLSMSHADWIREMRVHRPTLADVYFHATGVLFRP